MAEPGRLPSVRAGPSAEVGLPLPPWLSAFSWAPCGSPWQMGVTGTLEARGCPGAQGKESIRNAAERERRPCQPPRVGHSLCHLTHSHHSSGQVSSRFPDKETEVQGDRWLAQCHQAAMQQSQALTPGLVTRSLPSQTLMCVGTGLLLCQGRLLGRQIDPQKPRLCGMPGAESCHGERESWRAAT